MIDPFRHGPHTPCPIDSVEKLVAEYVALPGDSPRREMMERQYGRSAIAKLVAKYEEDRKNLAWIAASTMACPGCQVNVEKSRGCNHVRKNPVFSGTASDAGPQMTCSKCQKHFCYRCGVQLPASDPYEHFSTRGLNCYSKLFDYEG